MLGFAVAGLNWSPQTFWSSTPIEFNAGADYWIKINVPESERAKLGLEDDENPWADEDLVNRARELLAQV